MTLTIVQKVRRLSEGQPEHAKIRQHDIQYYAFSVGRDVKSLVISLTLLSDGMLGLYAIKNDEVEKGNATVSLVSTRPSATNYMWTNSGSDNNILVQKNSRYHYQLSSPQVLDVLYII